MPSFTLPDAAYKYRPLKRDIAPGWDIYALQTALNGAGYQLALDGVFGEQLDDAVRLWQEGRGLTVDGIAGIVTQRSVALWLAALARQAHRLPLHLLHGQVEAESGFQLGNHSFRYPDGSWDVGVVQRNNKQQGITLDQGFNAPASLDVLAKQIRSRHDEYVAAGKVSNSRAWGLAAGSWNRPAWTNWLAGVKPWAEPTPSQLDWIEGYISRALSYCSPQDLSRT